MGCWTDTNPLFRRKSLCVNLHNWSGIVAKCQPVSAVVAHNFRLFYPELFMSSLPPICCDVSFWSLNQATMTRVLSDSGIHYSNRNWKIVLTNGDRKRFSIESKDIALLCQAAREKFEKLWISSQHDFNTSKFSAAWRSYLIFLRLIKAQFFSVNINTFLTSSSLLVCWVDNHFRSKISFLFGFVLFSIAFCQIVSFYTF